MSAIIAPLPDRVARLDTIKLDVSTHQTFDQGHCAMEVVAWLAGEGHTDAPACASPVLTSFTISLNDGWDTDQRQKLKPYLPRMVGTRSDGQDEARSYLALDWLIRSYTPAWLDLAGLTAEAAELRALRRIVDLAAAKAAGPVVRAAQSKASAARAARAARDSAWATADTAAWVAAWAVAGVAAGDAAWAVAPDAAGNAAGNAAWDAAGNAAGNAAWDAARAAAGDAGWAAGDALAPTVKNLQASALQFLDGMIDPTAASRATL